MIKKFAPCALLALALGFTSCEKKEESSSAAPKGEATAETPAAPYAKHEEIANKAFDNFKALAEAASGATDEGAQAAADKIKEAADNLQTLADELKTMDPPPAEVGKDISKKMEAKMEDFQKTMSEDFGASMMKLSPESQQIIQEAMMGFFGKMETVGAEFERHFPELDKEDSGEETETPE